MKIVFEPHSTTFDNEEGRASGWNDVELSPAGIEQSKELGQRRKLADFDAIFTSDLQRAHDTAVLAFGSDTQKIFQDWRLRECNYGDMTGSPKDLMDKEKPKRIKLPFPNGESFEDANRRITNFLRELASNKKLRTVLIIGHRATHYGLETMITGKTLEQCIEEHASWKWQPGWEYELK